MIDTIQIKNFKSIKDLSIDLGRLNIIVGANGCGKTNILEAITMGSACSADKLDYEYLSNRIRITSPNFMRNAFIGKNQKEIFIEFTVEDKSYSYKIAVSKNDHRKWYDLNKLEFENKFKQDIGNKLSNIYDYKEFLLQISDDYKKKEISEFLIYTPEYSYLKKFEELAQISPLGVKGEGLFYWLKQVFSNRRNTKQINSIKEYLHLIDWFDDFDIPEGLMSNEYKIM